MDQPHRQRVLPEQGEAGVEHLHPAVVEGEPEEDRRPRLLSVGGQAPHAKSGHAREPLVAEGPLQEPVQNRDENAARLGQPGPDPEDRGPSLPRLHPLVALSFPVGRRCEPQSKNRNGQSLFTVKEEAGQGQARDA